MLTKRAFRYVRLLGMYINNFKKSSLKRQSLTKHWCQGFTIIELLVSVTLFSIAMTISISTLLIIIDANAKAQAVNAAMTNLSFAIDSMSRNIRTGYNHYCGTAADVNLHFDDDEVNDCSNQTDAGIVFNREKDGERVGYRKSGSTLYRKIGDSGPWVEIVASNITVGRFILNVDGGESKPNEQPEITIIIDGTINNGLDTDTTFSLQTNVSQRAIDL